MTTIECAPPGDRYVRFRTGDLDAAREQVTLRFAEHEMRVPNSHGRELDFHLDLAPSSQLTIGVMSYGTDTLISCPSMDSCYHVNLPLIGSSTAEQGGVRRTTAARVAGVALTSGSPLRVRWSPDAVQYVIKIPKDRLDAQASKLTGRSIGEVGLDLSFDLQTPRGQALLATAGFLYTELIRPKGLATMPAARHELESFLLTELLMVIPSQLTAALHGEVTHTRRTKIQEIVEFIESNPMAETSTADLAAAAGISARALQAGFQEVVGVPPLAYVRNARLDRVHRELEAGAGETVTEVASRWGVFHPGRFASQYRDRFGVLPSETARRHR